MEKTYIAYASGAQCHHGTLASCQEWASKTLANNSAGKLSSVTLGEVIGSFERKEPPVRFKSLSLNTNPEDINAV